MNKLKNNPFDYNDREPCNLRTNRSEHFITSDRELTHVKRLYRTLCFILFNILIKFPFAETLRKKIIIDIARDITINGIVLQRWMAAS